MSRTRYYCLNLISVSLHSWRAFYIIYLLQVPWFLILYNLYLYFNVLQSLWHIFLIQKLFKKDQNCMYLPIVKCHLHTKSLMPPSNFLYALCREKLFFRIENVHSSVILMGILFQCPIKLNRFRESIRIILLSHTIKSQVSRLI